MLLVCIVHYLRSHDPQKNREFSIFIHSIVSHCLNGNDILPILKEMQGKICSFLIPSSLLVVKFCLPGKSSYTHPCPSLTPILSAGTASPIPHINPHCLVPSSNLNPRSDLFWIIREPLHWLTNGNFSYRSSSDMDT